MVQALSLFMEFCYLARWSVLNEDDLVAIDAAVADFHRDHVVFDDIQPEGYSLPRQHSLVHYSLMIQEFGAPNGLCPSITKSKHIKAVKEPWQHSSHFEAIGQMLLTNQWLDKLTATRIDFRVQGMLSAPLFGELIEPVHLHHRLLTRRMMMMEGPLRVMFWEKSYLPKNLVRRMILHI